MSIRLSPLRKRLSRFSRIGFALTLISLLLFPTEIFGASIQAHYSMSVPQKARNTFQAACDRWASILEVKTTIHVYLHWKDISGGGLAGTTKIVIAESDTLARLPEFIGTYAQNTGAIVWIPGALATQFPNEYTGNYTEKASLLTMKYPMGTELMGEPEEPNADIHIKITMDAVIKVTPSPDSPNPYDVGKWYFGLNNQGLGEEALFSSVPTFDFFSTALHELGHGLGFTGGLDKNTCRYGKMKVYDYYPKAMFADQSGDDVLNEFYMLNATERKTYLGASDTVYWCGPKVKELYGTGGPYASTRRYAGILYPNGQAMLYSGLINYTSTYIHFSPRLGEGSLGETMVAFNSNGIRNANILGAAHVLADCGWKLKDFSSLVEQNTPIMKPVSSAKSSASEPWKTITLFNGGEGDLLIRDIGIQGCWADQFSLLNASELPDNTLEPSRGFQLEVGFLPQLDNGQGGRRTALLTIAYERNGEAGQRILPLQGYAIESDLDDDLIADIHECDSAQAACTGNPFLLNDRDSSGDSDAENPLLPDNRSDGYNDYDGDGVSNAEEFAGGSDPTDPNSLPDDDPNDGVSKEVMIESNATWNMKLLGCEVTGADADNYLITGGGASRTMAPGSTHKVWVAFMPLSAGDKSDAQLRIDYFTGIKQGSAYVELTGTGGQ